MSKGLAFEIIIYQFFLSLAPLRFVRFFSKRESFVFHFVVLFSPFCALLTTKVFIEPHYAAERERTLS